MVFWRMQKEGMNVWNFLSEAAVLFYAFFTEMLNEGVEISNEQNGTNEPNFTRKQVGRLLTQLGLDTIGDKLGEAISKANKDESKNV